MNLLFRCVHNFSYLLLLFTTALLCLLSNSIGFDIYHHAVSASSLVGIDALNDGHNVLGIELPRYLLSHYFFWGIGQLKVPFALGIVIIYCFLLHEILHLLRRLNFIETSVLVVLLSYFFVFFSLLGMSFLFLLAALASFLTSRRWHKYLFFSMACHPVGFIASGFLAVFYFKAYIRYLVYAVLILLASTVIQTTLTVSLYDCSESMIGVNVHIIERYAELFFRQEIVVGANFPQYVKVKNVDDISDFYLVAKKAKDIAFFSLIALLMVFSRKNIGQRYVSPLVLFFVLVFFVSIYSGYSQQKVFGPYSLLTADTDSRSNLGSLSLLYGAWIDSSVYQGLECFYGVQRYRL